MNTKFSVVTIVGPEDFHTRWLNECLESVEKQTYPAYEHILVSEQPFILPPTKKLRRKVITLSWLYGPGAMNIGIYVSKTDWIVNIDGDDLLMPEALEMMNARILEIDLPEFWLRMACIEPDGTNRPCGRCFHKNIWKAVGGYDDVGLTDLALHRKVFAAGYKTFDLAADNHPVVFFRRHDKNYSDHGFAKWKGTERWYDEIDELTGYVRKK